MTDRTPQRFTSRISGGSSRRLGRALEGAVDSAQRFNESVDVDKDGRLGVRVPNGGSLKVTSLGLELTGPLGDKTLVRMVPIDDLAASPAVTEISTQFNALLQALRDTFRMRTV